MSSPWCVQRGYSVRCDLRGVKWRLSSGIEETPFSALILLIRSEHGKHWLTPRFVRCSRTSACSPSCNRRTGFPPPVIRNGTVVVS